MSDNIAPVPSEPSKPEAVALFANEVPSEYVAHKLPAGVRRIVRVDRKAHVANAWRVWAEHPTAMVLEEKQPMRHYHQVVFTNGILTEYKDKYGNWVLGILTDSELICYTKPHLNPIKPLAVPGC
jgi:hypothetical protein